MSTPKPSLKKLTDEARAAAAEVLTTSRGTALERLLLALAVEAGLLDEPTSPGPPPLPPEKPAAK